MLDIMISGIYKIQSRIKPERFYIGSSIDIIGRWGAHRSMLRHKKHHSYKLQRHYNKYGIDDLEFLILEKCPPDHDILSECEEKYLSLVAPWFNICPHAGSSKERKFSDEYKKRKSEYNKRMGIKPPSCKGRVHSSDTKKRMREAQLGKTMSEESRQRMSQSKRAWLSNEDNIRRGWHHTDESKTKMRERKLGKKMSAETRRKMSAIRIYGDLIIDLETGIFYISIKEAAKAKNINYSTLKSNMLKGKNKTLLRRVDEIIALNKINELH